MKPMSRLVSYWTAAISVFWVVSFLLPDAAEFWGTRRGEMMAVKGAVAFGLLGWMQGIAIQEVSRAKPRRMFEFSATAGGLVGFGTVLSADVLVNTSPIVARVEIGFAIGAILGSLQLFPLRGLLRKPWLWPIATALAWGAGYTLEAGFVAAAQGFMEANEQLVIAAAGGTLACMVIGGISGVAIVKLIKPGDTHDTTRRTDETGEEHRR